MPYSFSNGGFFTTEDACKADITACALPHRDEDRSEDCKKEDPWGHEEKCSRAGRQ